MSRLRYNGMTKWTNPADKPPVKLHLYKYPPVIDPHPSGQGPGTVRDTGFHDEVIQPGESVLVPSEFDCAIQRCDESGTVISGCAPFLIKEDVQPDLHPALDPEEQKRVAAEREAAEALAKKQQADTALMLAQHRQNQAADAIARESAEAALAEQRTREEQAARDKLAKDQAEAEQLKKQAQKELAEAKKLKADAEKKSAEAEKALEQATAPSNATSSGAGNDSPKRGDAK
jgi:murein DD-endopeptidase MepM/ murein hydrolase activator NlpD